MGNCGNLYFLCKNIKSFLIQHSPQFLKIKNLNYKVKNWNFGYNENILLKYNILRS